MKKWIALLLPFGFLDACNSLPQIKTKSTSSVVLPGKTEPDPGTSVSRTVHLPPGNQNPTQTTINGTIVTKDVLKNASNLQLELYYENQELAVTRTNENGKFTFVGEFPQEKLQLRAAAAEKTWQVDPKQSDVKNLQLAL